MREVVFIALVLVCPLMMMLMMRGGHGHDHRADPRERSTEDLRRARDELDRVIDEREQGREHELTTSVWPTKPGVEQPSRHESHHSGGRR